MDLFEDHGVDGHLRAAADGDDGRQQPALVDGKVHADRRPQGMPHQHGPPQAQGADRLFHPLHVAHHVALARAAGEAVARQIDRRHVELALQRLVLVLPGGVIAARTVDKHDTLPALHESPVIHPARNGRPVNHDFPDHVSSTISSIPSVWSFRLFGLSGLSGLSAVIRLAVCPVIMQAEGSS